MKKKLYYIVLFLFFLIKIKSQNANLLDSIISNFFTSSLNVKSTKDILYIANDNIVFMNKDFRQNKCIKKIDSIYNINFKSKKNIYFAQIINMKNNNSDSLFICNLNYDVQKLINISRGNKIWKSEGNYAFNVFTDNKNNIYKIEFNGGITPFAIYTR